MRYPLSRCLLTWFACSLAAFGATPSDSFQIPADAGLPGAGLISRSDSFQATWRSRRENFAKQAQHDHGSIVVIGDSVAQGWGVGSWFPGVKIANRGINGDTTRGTLFRLQQDVLSLDPTGVVLLVGTDEVGNHVSPETIAGNLKLIAEACRAHRPDLPVILCLLLPSSTTTPSDVAEVRAANTEILKAVADLKNVWSLDSWSLFANAQGGAKPEEMSDLPHPNNLGYAKLANALRPVLEDLELIPAWPDEFQPEPGFTSLFNGRDLTGWTDEQGTDLSGRTVSDADSRYIVRNGRFVVTLTRVTRKTLKLWTVQKFPRDFVLKLEFRASPNGDSGIFVREPQLQCRDFVIAGPFSALRHYRPLDWNEIVVTVKGRLAHATCNGEVIMDAMPLPETGPIGLESDHGQMEYRRIQIREIPARPN